MTGFSGKSSGASMLSAQQPMWPLLLLTSCDAAPSQNILGSFFPAWMLCAAIGIVAAATCRIVFGAVRLHDAILVPPACYIAVAVAVTLFTWLFRFGN